MIYHYTDPETARRVIAAGVLLVRPVQVWADLMGPLRGDHPMNLAPAVWFTTSESGSPTVMVRNALDGIVCLWRFGVADDLAGDLVSWAEPHQYHPSLFRWMVATANLAGDPWEEWRLSPVDVPREKWLIVQSLHGDEWRDEPFAGA